jgi:hypothetical protein
MQKPNEIRLPFPLYETHLKQLPKSIQRKTDNTARFCLKLLAGQWLTPIADGLKAECSAY